MTQGLLPFQYLQEKNESNLTSFAGLPLYLEMAMISGLCRSIAERLKRKAQGWMDLQIVMSLILLNIVGGDCVEDIARLENDEGFSRLLLQLDTYGMKRKARRAYEKRFRKTKKRTFPSVSVIHRYLSEFHHAEEENKRKQGVAFIPAHNEHLQKLLTIQKSLIAFMQEKKPCTTATLDQDATLVETHKRSAYYSYENYKAYQPINTYWAEQGLLLHSEFRDGNVPAGYEQWRVLQEALEQLPAGVEKVYLRSDTAGYQQDILNYCAQGNSKRFGVIEFAIGTQVRQSFKAAVRQIKETDWQPIYRETPDGLKFKTHQEWAEVCYVPNWVGHSKQSPTYRYIAIRERMVAQAELQGLEATQQTLPFQTIDLLEQTYKLFGIVTNRTIDGNALINWYRERCGASEKVHHVEKNELAGGQLPSQKFGANAAWWQIMVMAFNLNVLMKALALPESLKTKGMKALRFQVIGVAGRVIQHARYWLIRLSGGQAMIDRIGEIRQRIAELAIPPPRVLTA